MRIYVAMDSFKGSLTSLQAGSAVKEAIMQVDPAAQVLVSPLADGGEGTVDALSSVSGSKPVSTEVTGPLGTPVTAQYCILPDGTAVIEMASAAGITLVPEARRDPRRTTTFGVGQLIREAIGKGCRKFIIGIGGSATNDGGTGMLTALGFAFLDHQGNPIPCCGEGLQRLASISKKNALPLLQDCSFLVACDVTNPLCGENGCSAVYGPQKGADAHTVQQMDQWLSNYARLSAGVSSNADPAYPGSGAAGGLGFAFRTFLNAQLRSGIDIILTTLDAQTQIKQADIVITGEGRLDGQSILGKAPIGIARLAKKHGKKVIAFSGCVGQDANLCNDHGIDAFFPIVPGAVTMEEALDPENARNNLIRTVTQVFRLIYT